MLEGEGEIEVTEDRRTLSEHQALQLMEQLTQEMEELDETYAVSQDLKKNIFFVEYACDEASQLSKFAERKGWEYLRLTRNTYDLRTKSARNEVMDIIRKKQRAGFLVILFGAIPCTPWTRWTDMNLHQYGEEYRKKLVQQRVENLLMVKHFHEIGVLVKEQVRSIIAYEWPAYCRGWENSTVQKLIRDLNLQPVRFDGCQVGVESVDGVPILKPWIIMTDCPKLINALEGKRCPRNHVHQECSGKHTERTGFYPPKMAKIILRAFEDACANSN